MQPLRCLFAVTLITCAVFVQVCFADASETVVLFRGKKTRVPYTSDDNKTVINRHAPEFRIPALVGDVFYGKQFLVALSDARYTGWEDAGSAELAARTSYGDYNNWKSAEIVGRSTCKTKDAWVGDATAVMKGNKVYVLVGSWDDAYINWGRQTRETGWEPRMYTGTVTNTTDNTGAYVKWDAYVSLRHLLPADANGHPGSQFIGGVGNSVVMGDGTIVMAAQVLNKKRQVMASIVYSKDDGKTWQMGGLTGLGLSEASVVEWGTGTLVMSLRVDNGPRQVLQTSDLGATWTEFTALSGVWGNQRDRKGPGCQASLIKVSVEGTDVMLFSHPLNTRGRYIRDRLQLWMSDGQRVFHVGEITKQGEGARSGYAVLAYIGETLYCLHEINPYDVNGNRNPTLVGWDRTVALSELSHMMDTVKATVRSWKGVDARLQSAGVQIKGLIGYLSSDASTTKWADAYGCVDATVHNAEAVEGGLRFSGAAQSYAQWPVSAQGQNQRYYSTRHAFTLVATVSIHGLSASGKNVVLGATLNEGQGVVLIEVGYTHDRKWFVRHSGADGKDGLGPLELNKEYSVAITCLKGSVSVFVDGAAVLQGLKLDGEHAEVVHFDLGGHSQAPLDANAEATVKNVMLYNRQLSESGLKAFRGPHRAKESTGGSLETHEESSNSERENKQKPSQKTLTGEKDQPLTNAGTATPEICMISSPQTLTEGTNGAATSSHSENQTALQKSAKKKKKKKKKH